MGADVVLFICHHTPLHDNEAARAAEGLAGGTTDVTVTSSRDFEANGVRRSDQCLYPSIEDALLEANHFIILLPPGVDVIDLRVGAELARYIGACKAVHRAPSIMIIHHPTCDPSPLVSIIRKEIVPLIASTDDSIGMVLQKIYGGMPGGAENLKSSIRRAIGVDRPSIKEDVAVSLTLTLSKPQFEQARSEGTLEKVIVVGGTRWPVTFGMSAGAGGAMWGDVSGLLYDPRSTGQLLARELVAAAAHARTPSSAPEALPVPLILKGSSGHVIFLAIRRYEMYADVGADKSGSASDGERHVFTFAVARWPMLHDPDDWSALAASYHLLVVSQLARYSLFKQDAASLYKLAAKAEHGGALDMARDELPALRASISLHLLLIQGEVHRRQMWNRLDQVPSFVAEAFGENGVPQGLVERLQSRLKQVGTEWELAARALINSLELAQACELGAMSGHITAASTQMRLLDGMNRDYLRVAAACFRLLRRRQLPLTEELRTLEDAL